MKTFASKFCGAVLLGVLVSAGGRPAQATPYNDGGTHTISGVDSDVTIGNGTTVYIVPGATITEPFHPIFGVAAVQVFDSGSTLNVTGGSITGGDGDKVGAPAVTGGGHLNFSGGIFHGGLSDATSSSSFGSRPAAVLDGFQSLSISGGDFYGGDHGNAADGVQIYSTSATAFISGGNFYGGISGSPFSTSNADGLEIHGSGGVPLSAVISGGTFHQGGGIGAAGVHLVGAVVNVIDGQFTSSILPDGNSVLNVSGGQFNPGASLNLHDNAVVNVTNGQINQINLMNASVANVSGGQLSGEFSLFDTSVMNLTGGHILYTLPPNFYMAQSSVLNVFGTGLSLHNVGGLYWELQGTLQDGTPIPSNTDIELFDNSVVNLFQIPEPSAIVLAAFGLLGLVAWGRPRKR